MALTLVIGCWIRRLWQGWAGNQAAKELARRQAAP